MDKKEEINRPLLDDEDKKTESFKSDETMENYDYGDMNQA